MNFRLQFPFFAHNPQLIYADSAATSHKPSAVIDAMTQFLSHDYATVHRSAYQLATESTSLFEQARTDIANLINATNVNSIVFTKGATEALNLVANGLSQCNWLNGDEILVCGSEHHANLLPWQRLANICGYKLRIMPMLEGGCLDVETSLSMITSKTAIVAIAHVSNALGNVYPVKLFTQKAKAFEAISIIDGTQAIPHLPVDVVDLDCDFYAFSGHKMFGPTGTGVLYGRYALLENLPAYQLGGEMVQQASYQTATYQKPPLKFEAGTPNIVGIVGLGQAAKFIAENASELLRQEKHLSSVLYTALSTIEGITLLGDFADGGKTIPIASFTLKDIHVNDLAVLLNLHKVAIRHGHHCAMPLMQALGVEGTLRISLAAYNTEEDVQKLTDILRECIHKLQLSNSAADKVPTSVSNNQQHLPLAAKIKASSSWDTVFRQIMLAGKSLNTMPEASRNNQHHISGCEADVWLMSEENQISQSRTFAAYSPSKVVRGLLAIVLEKANSLDENSQQTYDYRAYLAGIGLSRFLSESRQNGIGAVIDHIAEQ